MKSLIIPFLFLTLIYSCSRHGSTTSKIKLSGAGIFSGSFGTTASNGMILYGKSSDGKNFTKILDADSTDLEFPNGTWSFFAIAWDDNGAGALNNFKGTKKCGSSEGVSLNGSDTTINISLTTAGCSGFSFYSPRVTTCRNNALVNANSISLCSQGNNNKGYGTWMRIAVPEMKNFSQGNLTVSGNALRSYCVKIAGTTTDGGEATDAELAGNATNLLALSVPKDVMTTAEVFYSETQCDGSYGVDTFVVGGPKAIYYDSALVRRMFVESNENDVCRNERLTKPFASGYGTTFHPYTICTKAQWNNIGASYATLYPNSFELLSNLDFGMGPMLMIGEQVGSAMTGFSGTFNGNNHIVSNAMLTCPSAATSDSGVFRYLDGTSSNNFVKDITFNTVLNFCKFTNNTGGVAGKMLASKIDNVKYFGALEGTNYVGGLVGYADISTTTNQNFITKSHVNAHLNGYMYVGGLVGKAFRSSGTLNILIDKVSFKGEVGAHGSGGTPYSSYVGGIIGKFDGTGATSAIVKEAVVLADKIEGSQIVGGILGNATSASVEDSYVRTTFNGNTQTSSGSPVKLGGIVGESSSSVNILRSFNMMSYINPNTDNTDYSYGGLVGFGTTTCTNSYWIGNTSYSHGSNSVTSCNTSTITIPSSKLIASYNGFTASGYWTAPTDGYDYPRLAWEASEENKVTYLQRECVGSAMFQGTPVGSGTSLDPFVICTVDHFQNMTADNVYILKRDLNFNGVAFTPRPIGKYTVLGNHRTVQDIFISASANDSIGIFKALTIGSKIKNLKIKGANIYTSGASSVISGVAGVVAGTNNGDISGVNVGLSRIGYVNSGFNASGSPDLILGGAVGVNAASGSVSGDVSVSIEASDFATASNANGSVLLGGIVGKNNGLISGVKTHSEIKFYSSGPANDMTNNTFLAGAAAINDNVVREVEIDGSIKITNNTAFTSGYAGVVVAKNAGSVAVVRDIVAKSEINSSATYAPSSATYTLIPIQEAGSISKRILFEPRGDLIPTASDIMSNVTESICAMASPLPGCFVAGNLTYNADSSFGFHVKNSGTAILDVPNWNVTFGMSIDPARLWRMPAATSDTDWVTERPEIISASGSIDKIGIPFN